MEYSNDQIDQTYSIEAPCGNGSCKSQFATLNTAYESSPSMLAFSQNIASRNPLSASASAGANAGAGVGASAAYLSQKAAENANYAGGVMNYLGYDRTPNPWTSSSDLASVQQQQQQMDALRLQSLSPQGEEKINQGVDQLMGSLGSLGNLGDLASFDGQPNIKGSLISLRASNGNLMGARNLRSSLATSSGNLRNSIANAANGGNLRASIAGARANGAGIRGSSAGFLPGQPIFQNGIEFPLNRSQHYDMAPLGSNLLENFEIDDQIRTAWDSKHGRFYSSTGMNFFKFILLVILIIILIYGAYYLYKKNKKKNLAKSIVTEAATKNIIANAVAKNAAANAIAKNAASVNIASRNIYSGLYN